MKSVMQLALVALLIAVMAPMTMPGSMVGSIMGLTSGPVTGSGTKTQAERNADVRRRMALARERREAAGNARATRRTSRGTVSVEGDARGHFTALARINGKPIRVLVDTGASSVAMSRATAKRLGVRVKRSDFIHSASTANGRVDMAVATLGEVRIGDVRLENVEAAVLPDGALDGVLLGMSFLGRLDSFRVENGNLVMVQ